MGRSLKGILGTVQQQDLKTLSIQTKDVTAWNSRFVEKYIELQKLGETDEEKLFLEAGKALLAEGVILRRLEKARTVSILLSQLLLGLVVCRRLKEGLVFFLHPWFQVKSC